MIAGNNAVDYQSTKPLKLYNLMQKTILVTGNPKQHRRYSYEQRKKSSRG